MAEPAPRIDYYHWAGGREALLRLGPERGMLGTVLIAPALFEEANRLRGWTIALMRELAHRGVASVLPDLPGQGESVWKTEHCAVAKWRTALATAAASLGKPHLFAIRGGTLLDGECLTAGRYHFAPVPGGDLIRDLVRIRQLSAEENDEAFNPEAIRPPGPPVELAGNILSRWLIDDLKAAMPRTADRVARPETDARAAQMRLTGTALWRRARPEEDHDLIRAVATDITRWVEQCEG